MAAFLRKFLSGDQKRIAADIGRADSRSKLQIATCALLLEIADSDNEFSAEEKIKIIDILREKFALSEGDAHELIEISRELIDKSIDMWGFTSAINKAYSSQEKTEVLEAIWAVIYADGQLSGHEDSLVHKLSYLLEMKHEQLIAAKLKAKEKK